MRELKRIKRDNLKNIHFTNAMNGEEIAKTLGVTRQNISNVLKRAMKKMYLGAKELDPSWSPFQVSVVVAQMLGVVAQEDVTKMFNLFPPDIKAEIEQDAKNYVRGM